MALRKTGVELEAAGSAAFLSIMAQSGAAVTTFGATTDAAGRKAATFAQRIDALNTTIGLQKRQLAILEQQLATTAAAHGADSIAAQKQQLACDRLSASITNNERTAARLESELGALGKAEDAGAQKATGFGETMTGVFRRVGEIAVNALLDIGRAIASGVGEAVSAAGDYEQAMNVLQATSGATDTQMQAVKETAKALGADLTLPATSAASAGSAMLYLTQQGLSLNDAMAAAKGTLQLAAAGMVDEKVAAETTATALNQFGLAGTEATRIADLLAASVSASGSSVAQTGQAVQQAGTSFASAHVPIEDFVTLINEMSKAGIRGSDAGTSLKTMLMRLQAPTTKAADAMRDLNITVYDQEGAMRPMREIIGQFAASLSGLTQQQRDQAIVTIFGADAQRAANIVLGAGTAAFDTMRDAVTRSDAAAQLAGAQMQGFKGAAAGLQSQIETLSLEALEPILPLLTSLLQHSAAVAGSFVGKVGPAVQSVLSVIVPLATAFGDMGSAIVVGAVPALQTLTIATGIYALVNLPALITAVTTATAAFATMAGGMLMAAGPFAIIALAIAGVIIKANELSASIAAATDKVLTGKQFWTDSAAAVANYGTQSGATAVALKPLADNISAMRNLIHDEVEELGRRKTMGEITDAQMQAELVTINMHAAGLVVATQAYNDQEAALLRTVAGSMTATAQLQAQTEGQGVLTGQIQLTEEELNKLAQEMEQAYQRGTAAIEAYMTATLTFESQITAAVKSGNAEQAADVAANYAEQAAAARASIGEQLSAYTVAQMQLGNISKDQAGVILGAIEKEFGTTANIAGSTFLAMEQSIDSFAASGGGSADELGTHLDELANTASDTKAKMDALAVKYEAELVENFKDGKINADQLRKALEAIPAKVYSEVAIHTTYSSSGGGGSGAGGGGQGATPGFSARASGGPIDQGTPYIVGEHGPELVVPDRSGNVLNAGDTRRLLNQPASGGGSGGIAAMFKADATRAVQGFVEGLQAGQRAVAQAAGDLVGAAASGLAKGSTTVGDAVRGLARQVEEAVAGKHGGSDSGKKSAADLLHGAESGWPGRASGGPVRVGHGYMVGEHGPELFSPSVNGTIVPPATAGQILAGGGTTNNVTNSRTYNYAPVYASTPRAPSTDFATLQAWSN